MIRLIAQRVLSADFLDYASFRAVCTHWRSSTTCPRGRGIKDPCFHPQNWMMFPEGHGLHPGNLSLQGYVRFINLATGSFVRIFLPIFRDHCALDSVNGLLLLHRDRDTTIRLLHPFTGDTVDLPQLNTLAAQLHTKFRIGKFNRYVRGICSSVSVDATGTVSVMLALHRLSNMAVATANSNENQWTLSGRSNSPLIHTMPFSFQGKLYIMWRQNMSVHILEISQSQQGSVAWRVKLAAICPLDKLCMPLGMAECGGDILVLGFSDESFLRLSVYKLADLMLKRYVPVTSIGDRSIFIGQRSLCVSI